MIEREIAETVMQVTIGLAQLIRAGKDADARTEALMSLAETMKAALDREKFGEGK